MSEEEARRMWAEWLTRTLESPEFAEAATRQFDAWLLFDLKEYTATIGVPPEDFAAVFERIWGAAEQVYSRKPDLEEGEAAIAAVGAAAAFMMGVGFQLGVGRALEG